MSKLSERRKQIREYNLGEAEQELDRLRRQLFDLRIQQQRGEVKNNRQFTQVRTDIARLMYQIDVLNQAYMEEELAEEEEEAAQAEETGGPEALQEEAEEEEQAEEAKEDVAAEEEPTEEETEEAENAEEARTSSPVSQSEEGTRASKRGNTSKAKEEA